MASSPCQSKLLPVYIILTLAIVLSVLVLRFLVRASIIPSNGTALLQNERLEETHNCQLDSFKIIESITALTETTSYVTEFGFILCKPYKFSQYAGSKLLCTDDMQE